MYRVLIIIALIIATTVLLAGGYFILQPDHKIKESVISTDKSSSPSLTPTNAVNTETIPITSASPSGNPTVGNPLSVMAAALSKRDGAQVKDLLAGTVVFTKLGTSYFEQKTKDQAVVKIFSILDATGAPWDFSTTSQINSKIHDQVTQLDDTLVGNSAGSVIVFSLNPDTGFFAVNSALVSEYGL